jgi:ubiquinol-cytochrome c reductase cytochrome c1 subunit
MKKLIAISGLLLFPALLPILALAQEAEVRLDTAPVRNNPVELQSGARTFVNYCLSCHGAQSMRFNRLRDLGLSEAEIRDNLIFTGAKVGDTMKVALTAKDGKQFFGTAPPDLSVIARSRGADWLYTYLRTFYRDPSRPTGWNNVVFPNVGMPHVLYTLQGEQVMKPAVPVARPEAAKEEAAEEKGEHPQKMVLQIAKPGSMTPLEYDATVADLVSFLVYVGEPAAAERKTTGYYVLFALFLLSLIAYALKREFWKDVH